ncbi:putative E3 ubiquitin-protein ligase [Trichinella spiralis]|uniref:E3 ubiquitin-protein ligase n=1 Tax=Trichinella spiralis TaxID=6334 RepID=A0ABR3KIM2_TRISP
MAIQCQWRNKRGRQLDITITVANAKHYIEERANLSNWKSKAASASKKRSEQQVNGLLALCLDFRLPLNPKLRFNRICYGDYSFPMASLQFPIRIVFRNFFPSSFANCSPLAIVNGAVSLNAADRFGFMLSEVKVNNNDEWCCCM